MKRKKQIVRNIILIALTALLFLWQGGYHLTPEAVFRSAEKAEWLGPAAEVIEVGQRDDILLPLAQRINQHGEYIETVVHIFAEQMLMDHVLEITVGGGDNAYINFDGYGAAHTGDLFFLNGAQQLCLESKGQFAHFVEKQCAVLGCFPQAGFAFCAGAGEGSFFVAEQL